MNAEVCYHVEVDTDLNEEKLKILDWILREPHENAILSRASVLDAADQKYDYVIEIGPRFNFSTADSTNSVSICQNAGLPEVKRLEKSIRYYISDGTEINPNQLVRIFFLYKYNLL